VLVAERPPVVLQPRQRRVKVASQNEHAYLLPIRYDADDPELEYADAPWDPTRIPGLEDRVPADSAWAVWAPPTQFRGNPAIGNVQERLFALGQITGRTWDEIVRYAGQPGVVSNSALGRTGVWQRSGFFSFYSLALQFDPYGVCRSVGSEINT